MSTESLFLENQELRDLIQKQELESRESFRRLGEQLVDLPKNLAAELKPYLKGVAPSTSTEQARSSNLMLILATVSIMVAITSPLYLMNALSAKAYDEKLSGIERRMEQDDVRESADIKQITEHEIRIQVIEENR